MKSLSLLLILIVICCIPLISAAGNNTSIIYRQIGFRQDNYANSQWTGIDSSGPSDYTYDSVNDIEKQYVKQWNGTVWVPGYCEARTFNSNRNPLTYSYTVWSDTLAAYQNQAFTIYVYDNLNQLTADTEYIWNGSGGKFVPAFLDTYTYDQNSYESDRMFYKWDSISNSWFLEMENSYIHYHGSFYQSKYEAWNNDSAEGGNLEKYTFDTAGNILSDTSFELNTNSLVWQLTGCMIYVYNQANKPTLQASYAYDTLHNAFMLNYKDSSVYDSHNYLIDDYVFNWGLGSTPTSYWDQYTNDSKGNILVELELIWNSATQSWQNSFKDSMQYNSHNQWTMILSQNWDSTHWVNSNYNQLLINYNDSGRVIEQAQNIYKWADGNWVIQYRSLNQYNANNNQILTSYQNNYISDNSDTSEMTGSRSYYYYEALDISNNPSSKPSSLLIYPDPASESLTIALPEIYANVPFSVYDLIGQRMTSGLLNGNNYSIDISGYSDGVYVLKVNNLSQKFVVKR